MSIIFLETLDKKILLATNNKTDKEFLQKALELKEVKKNIKVKPQFYNLPGEKKINEWWTLLKNEKYAI